jgi:hypothetical protein
VEEGWNNAKIVSVNQKAGSQVSYFKYFGKPMVTASVADPDPSDSYVFGPPGSVRTRYGSRSGSFHHQAKIIRNTAIPTAL